MSLNADPELIWRLFRKHVPEVANGIVKIVGIARDPGRRTIVTVSSNDRANDPVGVCVGHRGQTVKTIVAELGGEYVDIVLWSNSVERFVANMMLPVRLSRVTLDDAHRILNVVTQEIPESRRPNIALWSELLMNLTGWKLNLEIDGKTWEG